MANLPKAIIISTGVYGNGTDTVFVLDLLKDPYNVIGAGNPGGPVENWFSKDPRFSLPTGVQNPGSSNTVSLSGTVVTYTFATAPTGQTTVEFTLTF